MTDDQRLSAMAWLKSITDKELIEVMHEVQADNRVSSPTSHFVLASTSLDRDTGNWDLEVVGLHDPEEYPRGFDADAPLCQFGHCSGCGYAVVSWAKHAKCSVCGGSVYCT